jgi:anti-sigma factor RsiW
MSPRCLTEEELAGYAFDALAPGERKRVQAHARACPSCRARIAEAQALGDALLAAPVRMEPPAGLGPRILDRARGTLTLDLRHRTRRRGTLWLGVAAALLLAANGLQLWQAGHLRAEIARLRAAGAVAGQLGATATVERQLSLVGTAVAPGASAQVSVVREADQEMLLLTASGLPALRGAEVYHLWLLQGDRRRSGGTFTVAADGRGALVVHLPTGVTFDAVGVTREPNASTRQPQGPKVLGETG